MKFPWSWVLGGFTILKIPKEIILVELLVTTLVIFAEYVVSGNNDRLHKIFDATFYDSNNIITEYGVQVIFRLVKIVELINFNESVGQNLELVLKMIPPLVVIGFVGVKVITIVEFILTDVGFEVKEQAKKLIEIYINYQW